MHFELRSNRVKMFMPRDKESWFNLLVLHQNRYVLPSSSLFVYIGVWVFIWIYFSRVKHGPQEYVPEGMFDDSIDLVVWGHEHDCRVLPEPVAGKNYYITQPGSSVATSLADGEAVEKYALQLTYLALFD
jgi:double-strand break repair protein MRE11